MGTESKIRNKSKSLTTAILMIIALSGTATTAISSYMIDLVYAQQHARINVIIRVECNPPTPNCPKASQFTIGVMTRQQSTATSIQWFANWYNRHRNPGFVSMNVVGQLPPVPPGYTLNPKFPPRLLGQVALNPQQIVL